MIMSACGRVGAKVPWLSLLFLANWNRCGNSPKLHSASLHVCIQSFVSVCVFFPLKVILLLSSHLETREEGNGKANC